MTSETATPGDSVKRRQYLLLIGIAAVVLGAAFLSVVLTTSKQDSTRTEKPRTTSILAPGAQVDPKDAWRGQADAQMQAIDQKSREVAQKNLELGQQNKEMLERLKKLEQSALTPLPPPPVPAAPSRSEFGPDASKRDARDSIAGAMVLPPSPAARAAQLPMPPGQAANLAVGPTPAVQPTIISVSLGDGPTTAKAATGGASDKSTGDPKKPNKSAGSYMPSGSFTRAVLLGGLDAPTGGQSQKNPQPVLLRLTDNAILPNQFRFRVKECFVVGAGFGDISSERAYIRTETLSCVTHDGQAIDIPIKGYVAGEDGKAGMRGRLVSKQGQLLANALIAGVASGFGQAFQQSATTVSVSPLGTTSTVNPAQQFNAGFGAGVGKALDRLAQYYITLAEKVFPVIEIDAGRTVDVVITTGATIEGLNGTETSDDGSFDALTNRNRILNRRSNDSD